MADAEHLERHPPVAGALDVPVHAAPPLVATAEPALNVRGPGVALELLVNHEPTPEELEPYELLLGDAMKGDAFRFARMDYVDEAWRIVDPVLKQQTPVHNYEPKTWGPKEAEQQLAPTGGWHNPTAPVQEEFSLEANA